MKTLAVTPYQTISLFPASAANLKGRQIMFKYLVKPSLILIAFLAFFSLGFAADAYAGERISKEILLKHLVGPAWLGKFGRSGREVEFKYERGGVLKIYIPEVDFTIEGTWKVDDGGTVCTEFSGKRGMAQSCRHYEYLNKPPGISVVLLRGGAVRLSGLSKGGVSVFEQLGFQAKRQQQGLAKIRRVQTSLKKIGLYKGTVDGRLTPTTLRAMLKWSKESGFAFNGVVSPELLSLIELDASESVQAEQKKLAAAQAAQTKVAAAKAKKRLALAAAQAKAAAAKVKKRLAVEAKAAAAKVKKRRAVEAKAAAATARKRQARAVAKAKSDAAKKRRAARAKEAAKKKRQAARVAAATRKRQKAMIAVTNADQARTFLKDFKDFVSKDPAVYNAFKMAVLFAPAQEVVSNNQYGSQKRTFQKLVKFANSNKRYRAYRVNRQIKRKQVIKAKRKTVTENIKQLIALLRQKIIADPLAPSTSKIIRIVGVYEKPFKGKTLNNLNKVLANLSSEMRTVGIEPPVGNFSLASNSPRGKKRKIVSGSFRSIPQLRGIKENDIVFLANLNSSAPHTYRDLNGAVKFEKSTIVACGPKVKNWDRQALIFAQYKIDGLYPKHAFKRGSCKGKIGSVDVIMARGVDLAKSKELPSEVAFAKGFRSKKLSLIFIVKASDVSDELKRRTILSSQYKNDIMEEARSGFGAISGNNKSSVGCVIVSDLRDAHQSFVDQASKARTFQSGIETRKNVDVSLSVAFRQLQKKTCGLIYAGEKSLKKLIEASKNSDLKITVLPVWTSASKVERQAAVLLNKQNMSEQSKGDRLAALKRKLVEDSKQRAARAAELSQQQARYRTTYGAKVTSLVAAIDTQLKSMRSQIDKTLSNKGSVRTAIQRQSFWGELPGWYGSKRQKGWEFGSTVATPADYGTATWKGRNIKAIVAKVRFLMKQPDLGEYSDTCWYVGYLADAEFSRKREPFVASCKKPSALKNWFVVNRFKTQWDLGVR